MENRTKNGFGIYRYTDGKIFLGQYINNKKEG